MWYGHPDVGTWGWVWMVLMMVLVWVPLIALIAWLVRPAAGVGGAREPQRQPEPDADPVEVARRAYARGELSRDRYLQIVEDLRDTARPRISG